MADDALKTQSPLQKGRDEGCTKSTCTNKTRHLRTPDFHAESRCPGGEEDTSDIQRHPCWELLYHIYCKKISDSTYPNLYIAMSESGEETEIYQLSSDELTSDSTEDLDISTPTGSEYGDHNSSRIWVRTYSPSTFPKPFIFSERTGPQHCPSTLKKPIDYFFLFFSIDLFRDFARFTNKYVKEYLKDNIATLPSHSRLQKWKEITTNEMMAFFGIIFNMGLNPKNQIRNYWSKERCFRQNWFPDVMSRNRFELIYSFFTTCDSYKMPKHTDPGYDPTLKYRDLINHVNFKFLYYYKPTQHLSIDESLVCLKNRTRLLQYMPNKHHGRFGIKLWMLCEARTGYCLQFYVYKGVIYHVVMDNFFTSVDLAKDLAGKQTYLTGTIRSNRRGYPKTLKRASLHVDEVIYMKSDMQLAAAYKEKAKRKSINFLSTYCDAVSETKPETPIIYIPQVKTVYDKYMGGVDLSDMMMYCYMDERKGRKHHRKVVINIIHRALLNSYILYSQHSSDSPKLTRHKYQVSVINSLVEGTIKGSTSSATTSSNIQLEKLTEKKERQCVECRIRGEKRRSRTICSGCKMGLHGVCTLNHRCK
ncbi:hypothetical protein LAZ67_21001916 [Cordylochernes scorpioides]|uniref:PiggyBac transposable element-derived protein domain-containing protein n=1 Tax=Cordylochernes scorpioides TaxID=51811 RepID=A0ABY6LMI3_9ARAC|nr:hypothetical protein LAZ67_21001916 [Cordylochernes scorpioides]